MVNLETNVPSPLLYTIDKFADGTLHIQRNSNFKSDLVHELGLVCAIQNHDDFVKMLLMADTPKREGVQHLQGIFPYLFYLRQDKENTGQPLSSQVIISALEHAGFDLSSSS